MKSLCYVALICTAFLISLTSFSPNKNSGLIQDVLSQTNQFRKSKGLKELIIRDELNAIAQQHSINMAKGRVAFGHDGFEQRNTRATAAIRSLHSFAENVAYGATSGSAVVTMWKNSSGHRRNMLGNYRFIGIGVAKDRQGRIYYTQVFGG